jgi:hypothetical protein
MLNSPTQRILQASAKVRFANVESVLSATAEVRLVNLVKVPLKRVLVSLGIDPSYIRLPQSEK